MNQRDNRRKWIAIPAGITLFVFACFLFCMNAGYGQTNTFPATGYVGIGTTSPGFALTMFGTDWNSSQISLTTFAGTPTPGGTDNYTPQFRFEKARGTSAASVKLEDGDRIGAFLAAGHDGVKMQRSAVFGFRVDGPTSVGTVPIGFFVQTGDNSTNKPERFLISSAGKVVINDLIGSGTRMVTVDASGMLASSPISGGPVALNDLTDVNTSGAVNGSLIKYNGSSWVVGSDKVDDADANPTNELQTISKSGTTVTLSNGGGSVSIADNDNSTTNEIQSLNLTGNILSLSLGGGLVNLSGYLDNTDAQTLSYNSITGALTISNGNTVTLGTGGTDNDWAYFSGSGLTGEIYHSGDVAMGMTDPDGFGLNVQNYINGKAAVRGADESTFLYAEGMLGVLNPSYFGVPIPVTNVGVLGMKPANGSNGAAIYGWNSDHNPTNYAGIFVSDGMDTTGNINYGVYSIADNALTNMAGHFEGRVEVDGHNGLTGAQDYMQDVFTSRVTHNLSADTRAVYGLSVPTPGYGYGVYGQGGWRGVYGYGDGQDYLGSTIGVYGYSTGTAGARYGLYGYASNSGGTNAYGVYGYATGATTNYAGYFSGDVGITGDLNLGTSSPAAGRIDLDADNVNPTLIYADQNSTLTSGSHYGVRVDNNPATTSESFGFYTERNAGADGGRTGYRNYMTGGTGYRYGFSSSIYADVTNTGTVYGLYSYISGSATTGTSYAGYFSNSGGSWATYAVGNAYVSGDLVVGSTIPAAGYKFSVNGKAAVEELLIDDSGFWPDYVFDEGYDLMPIEDLKHNIRLNGHLPGVPSAAEVEEDGILVGQMQKLTMEKVEELTLYIIQLNDRLKAVEQENEELKAKLSK